MTKKRHLNLYSKPPSTVPAVFSSSRVSHDASGNASSSSSAPGPSVNEILAGLRKSGISSAARPNPPVAAPSLPPPISHLLEIPETPQPRPRHGTVRRMVVNGRRLPPGPAPPSSWLGVSRDSLPAPSPLVKSSAAHRPASIDHLPGLYSLPRNGSLFDVSLRQLAANWHLHVEYDHDYLATLPPKLRELVLSYVVLYGPEEGVGYYGLCCLLGVTGNTDASTDPIDNEEIHRLDLSHAIGRSVSFKQLLELVTRPSEETHDMESWETTAVPRSLQAPIPLLTHLSISHPPPGISWTKLLKLSSSLPTVTHLSLAHWPTPSATPNSRIAKVSSSFSPDVHYGATNLYSHSLDDDWAEAASILKRLATNLYSLRYLDLDGCTAWVSALRYSTLETHGVDWKTSWGKLDRLCLRSDVILDESSGIQAASSYKETILETLQLEKYIRRERGHGRIFIDRDDWKRYDFLIPNPAVWNARYQDAIRSGPRDIGSSVEISSERRRRAAAAFWD